MKLMKAFVVLMVAAGLIIPVAAIAEDRLSLSGEMRVRGWYDDSEIDGTDLPTKTFADQRLRIGGKIAIAEGVSVTFRTDITETQWGAGGSDFGAGRMASTQQWDRAHIDLASGNFHLRAGQQYIGTGTAFAFDTQEAGLSLDYVGAAPVKAWFLLDNNNDDLFTYGANGTTGSNADALEYGVMISPKGDNWKSSIFVAGQSKRNNSDEEVYLVGVNGALDLDAVKLVGEIDFFGGDANASQDAEGLQIFVDASTSLGAATVGLQGFYAQGEDSDVQYTGLGNGFNGWDPIFDVGTSLSNEEMDLGDNIACDALGACSGVFDFTGLGAGVVGARLYGNTSFGATSVGASIAYLENEEDFGVGFDAEALLLAAGLVYPVLENTSFQVQLQYSDAEVEGIDGDSFQAGTGLFVKF